MLVHITPDHDETTSLLNADIIEAINYHTVYTAIESSEDSSAIVKVNGRRFKIQLWEIV